MAIPTLVTLLFSMTERQWKKPRQEDREILLFLLKVLAFLNEEMLLNLFAFG